MRLTPLWLLSLCLTAPLGAVQQTAASAHRLGTVRFDISCDAIARPRFNHAVALLHSFGFPEAVSQFNAGLAVDRTAPWPSGGLH